MIFNIAVGEDDDGNAAGAEAKITEEQVAEIRKLIMDASPPESKNAIKLFLQWAGLERIEDMPASKFEKAKSALEHKINSKANQA